MLRAPLAVPVVLGSFGLGLVLQLVQAWGVGDLDWFAHHVAQFSIGAATWWFAAIPRFRRLIVALVLTFGFLTPVLWMFFAFTSPAGEAVSAAWGITLWWGHPHLLGIAVASTTALAAAVLPNRPRVVVLLWIVSAITTVGVWSRGATAAIALGFLVWLATRFRLSSWRSLSISLGLGVGVVLASFGFGPEAWTARFGPGTAQRFTLESLMNPNANGGMVARLRSHGIAVEVIRDTFPSGAGMGGFHEAAVRVGALPSGALGPSHAHHQVLELLATFGVLGTIAWFLPLTAAVVGLRGVGIWLVAPVIAVQTLLWGIESPFLTSAAFYSSWVALGVARQAALGTWGGTSPCATR